MTVTVRSGLTDGALQYANQDMITISSGNVYIPSSGNLNVAGSGAFIGNLTLGGNQVLTTISGGLGYGQTWQNFPTGANPVTQRQTGTLYTNSTGKPIMVAVIWPNYGSGNMGGFLYSSGVLISVDTSNSTSAAFQLSVMGIIPVGATYQVTQSGVAFTSWAELR